MTRKTQIEASEWFILYSNLKRYFRDTVAQKNRRVWLGFFLKGYFERSL